ncbi:MAG: methyl-accepting chemotaxis protein [Epsilonproteobacteria bacterium]|nr:methyl-accepting chemotaxis protein [Campylobacterota bacterium]
MKNFKISTLLYSTIGISSVLLFILILLNYFSLSNIKNDFITYKMHTKKMDLYSSLQVNTLRMRVEAKDILITDANDQKVDKFFKYSQKTLKRIDEVIKLVHPKTQDLLFKVKDSIINYQNHIKDMINVIKQNKKLFSQIRTFKDDFATNLKLVIDNKDDLVEGLSAFYDTQAELLRFKIKLSKEDEIIIKKDLKILQKDISKIKNHLGRLGDLAQKYEELTDEYNTYKTLVTAAIKNLLQVKHNISTTSKIGDEVTQIAQELKVQKRKDLAKLEEDLLDNINSTITTTVIISLLIMGIISSLLYFISKLIIDEIKIITNFLKGDTNDLTRRVEIDSNNEIAQIANSINQFFEKMQYALIKVKEVSDNVNTASNQVNQNAKTIEQNISEEHNTVIKANELTQNSKEEVENVNYIIEKMHKMADDSFIKLSNSVESIVEFIDNIKQTSQKDLEIANKVMGLKDATEQVREVMGIISEIADQTNLLALNAAIEAARAGEHGRGFAVVADEVRQLAEKTQNSLNEINTTIKMLLQSVEEIASEIQNNVEVIENVSNSATQIEQNVENVLSSIENTKTLADETAGKSNRLTKIIETIAQIMDNIKQISDKNELSAKEIEKVTQNLKEKVQELENEINNFKI